MPAVMSRRTCSPSGLPGGNGAHSSSPGTPSSRRSAASCSPVSWAPWFSGSPANGNRQPLRVHARIATGRSGIPSASANASTIASRSWPPRSASSAATPASPSASRRAVTSAGAASPSAFRAAAGGSRRRAWYSRFSIASSRPRSQAPPGSANSRSSRRPKRSDTTCQPSAPKRRPSCRLRRSPTTRSRLWRFRSTTTMWPARSAIASSVQASQTLPSSSSASPTSAMFRGRSAAGGWPGSGSPGPPKRSHRYRSMRAAKAGATAPRPIDPVEKSNQSGFFARLGYAWRPPSDRYARRLPGGRSPRRTWMA
jgi:hypothetical protein